MKRSLLLNIVTILGALVGTLLPIALFVIEMRMVFAGDAFLYENAGLQMARLLLRAASMFLFLGSAIMSVVAIWRSPMVPLSMGLCIGCVGMALVSFFFYEWYLGLILLIAEVLLLFAPSFIMFRQRFLVERED